MKTPYSHSFTNLNSLLIQKIKKKTKKKQGKWHTSPGRDAISAHSSVFKQIRKCYTCDILSMDVIYQTRKRVFHQDIQTPRSGLKKRGAAEFFLTDFEVFGYLMKHSFEFLIWLLKPFIILGEIQSKSSQNFMLIKNRYPNHHHGSDFLCFLFMNY